MSNKKLEAPPGEPIVLRQEVDRRTFLKATGVAAAGATAALNLPGAEHIVLHNLATTADQAPTGAADAETIVPTFCRPNCFNGCRVNAHVRDGKVVKTSMAQFPDERYNRICLRGLSQPQQMYSERRLKYPMKRAGERGEGKWERISWEEALDTVATKLQETREKYGTHAVSFTQGSGNFGVLSGTMFGLYHRLFSVLEATCINNTLDVAQSYGLTKVFGKAPGNDQSDLANARTLFIIGSNMTEAQIHTWHFVADAIDNGAKVIVIDPVYTATASKAHQWVRIRPGSDGALFLSMIHVILNEGLEDTQYVHDHTVAPFLVRADTGKFLRQSDATGKEPEKVVDAATGRETIVDPYMVWSVKSSRAVPLVEGVEAAVTGSYTVNGIEVTVALDLLKAAVAEYTPERAEEITTVPAETIRQLAVTYATAKPATLYHCMGIDHWDNGHMTTFAEGTLAAITGNVGKYGASLGFKWYYIDNLDVMGFIYPDGKFAKNIYTDDMFETARTGNIMGKPDPIKAMFVACCNPLGAYTDRNVWIDTVLPSIDFIVTADIFDSDTVEYSDIVLPVAHWFETTDMHFGQTHPYVMYAEAAAPPAFESKSDMEIIQLLAARLGVNQYFDYTPDELLEMSISKPFAERTGFTLEQLKKDGVFKLWYQSPDTPNITNGLNGIFATPSQRAEFYNEDPKPRVASTTSLKFNPEQERLPRFVPPLEAWPESEAAKKYPLAFFQEHTRWRVHTQFADVPLLRELDPEPTVKLNPDDAAARGIRTGDDVEIFNDRGHVVVKAVLSSALPAGMVSLPKGWLARQHKRGAPGQLTHMNLNPASINQSFFDVAVDVRKWTEEA